MVAKYFAGGSIVAMGNPVCVGAGINLAIDAGAQVGKTFSISANEYGGSNMNATPQYAFRPNTGTNDALRLPVLGGFLVDAEGNRFINEGFACERAMFAGDTFIREKYCYAVADQSFVDRLSSEPVPSLFVCGVDADIYTSPLWLMACENGFAIASGLIAGESAAAYAKA